MAESSSSPVIFADMPPALADSWRARLARVPMSFFKQLLDMGFPDWLCVIALERTESVGAAPALDFCLEHVNDDFAGDPHAAPQPAVAAPTAPAAHSLASQVSRIRPPLSLAEPADVRLSIGSPPSSIESSASSRSVLSSVADAIVSATAEAASGPLRALSRTLSSKRSSSSESAAPSSAPDTPSRPRAISINDICQADQLASANDPSENFGHTDVRRTRSAPAAPPAAALPPNAVDSAPPPRLHRSISDSGAAATGAGTTLPATALQRFASAGRAAVTAVDAALAGVFNKEAPPFDCIICGENFPVEMRCALPCNKQTSSTCSEMWVCSNCVRRNIEVNVTDGDLQRLCPVCNGDFSEDFIREHSSDDLFQKYTRFKINKSNPNMRTCSKCNVLSEGSSAAPSMRCSNCSHTFCFTHGDSHPGKSCSQWARDNLQSEKETEKAIKSFTKMCPGCHVATQKSAGCNHMKCTQCKTEWCWLCASAIVPGGSYPSHYAKWNIFGCAGAQFSSGESQPASSICVKLLSVLLSPIMLAAGLALLAIWLPFFPLWAAMYACESRRGRLAFFIFTLKVEGGILLSPVLASVALFYLALLLPGVPFALIMWKMRYGADDFDDFLEHCMPTWFLFLSFLIFFGPALAISAVAGVGALACFLVSFPCLLFSSKRNIYSKVLQKSFLAFALPPAVAVAIALFPFSIPTYFIIRDDDD